MNVILVTRCGCKQQMQLSATEPPPGIKVELDLSEKKAVRRFSYVGKHQIHQTPMYLEDDPHARDQETQTSLGH